MLRERDCFVVLWLLRSIDVSAVYFPAVPGKWWPLGSGSALSRRRTAHSRCAQGRRWRSCARTRRRCSRRCRLSSLRAAGQSRAATQASAPPCSAGLRSQRRRRTRRRCARDATTIMMLSPVKYHQTCFFDNIIYFSAPPRPQSSLPSPLLRFRLFILRLLYIFILPS